MKTNLKLGHTNTILKECKKANLNIQQTSYIMATAYHETNATIKPVKEAYWLSENWRKSNLRYYPWYGRGFVQLTWEDNYIFAGKRLGVDLTTNPDAALDPKIAAEVLVLGSKEGWFTKGKYTLLNLHSYKDMRRIINGTDKATLVAGYAENYEIALRDLW